MPSPPDFPLLVAHPDIEIRCAIKKQLRSVGYHKIAVADSGRSTLNRLLSDSYNALIVSMELPDLNCWQLLQMIGTGVFCRPQQPMLVVCGPEQVYLAEPLAQKHHMPLLALDQLERLPDTLTACIGGLKKPLVLLIEDRLDTANLIKLKLQLHFEVEIALTGEEGLGAWKTKHHDLILLDLMLPGMSGADVLQKILVDKPSQPVIIITARLEPETQKKLMLAGAAAYLTKPVDLDKLPNCCEQSLHYGVYKQQRALQEAQQARERSVGQRLHAAHFLLASGQIGSAAQHLKRAIAVRPEELLGDDAWAALLTEFE
ncbi:MAG TPA: response regulator [Candidatus Competibacter sp.]|nr:response regulator [Candidatus Competibacter sp.]